MSGLYELHGGLGSPYSLKMRAILRYRRIAHVWRPLDVGSAEVLAHVRVPVIPVMRYPDGSWHNESTDLALDLERRHDVRSILPGHAGRRFLALLIEDMADEWLTKAMFHYRWYYHKDARLVATWLAYDRLRGDVAAIRRYADTFATRQIDRMPLVGCTEANAPVIEGTTLRLVRALEAQCGERPYLFGSRPSLAEFGLYGQLSQLLADPTPGDLLKEEAPLLARWVMQIDDASGVEGVWDADDVPIGDGVRAMLMFAGSVYLPFLAANAAAIADGADRLSVRIDDADYAQAPFRFQAKCLARLRLLYASLDARARAWIDPLLEESKCRSTLDHPPA